LAAFNTYCTAPVEALYKFHACGREDVDVRMLGTGRPFVIEATNPHVTSFSGSLRRESFFLKRGVFLFLFKFRCGCSSCFHVRWIRAL